MPPVTLRLTNGTDCGFSEPNAWLKAPFRPPATYFDGAKYANPCAPVPAPASPGFLRPDTDSGGRCKWAIHGPVQLNRHPCRLPPESAPGLSLHPRRVLRCSCHRATKAHQCRCVSGWPTDLCITMSVERRHDECLAYLDITPSAEHRNRSCSMRLKRRPIKKPTRCRVGFFNNPEGTITCG